MLVQSSSLIAAVSESVHSPIRPNALFIRSEVIKHLSTSKVFSWATSLGAGVMGASFTSSHNCVAMEANTNSWIDFASLRYIGIEWLNDTTLHLLFPTPAAALLALTLLSKAGFDPSEGDDPILERSAHTVPIHLLPRAELDPTDSQAGTELLAGAAPDASSGPRRRGRGNFAGDSAEKSELPSVAGAVDQDGWRLAEGVDPNARITVRFAIEEDSELRREAKASDWYKRHGRKAGKEISTASRRFGREEAPSWEGRTDSETGEGRAFAKRLGARERMDPYARPRGRGTKTADDLDKELEGFARQRNGDEGDSGVEGMQVDDEMDGNERRRERRPKRGVEDLDTGALSLHLCCSVAALTLTAMITELDDMFAARSTVS